MLSFKFQVVFILNWLQAKAKEPSLPNNFSYSWEEKKIPIHVFPKETLVQSECKLPQLEFEFSMPIPFPMLPSTLPCCNIKNDKKNMGLKKERKERYKNK